MSVFSIKHAFRFAIVSGIGKRRKTEIEKETGFRQEWYLESYRPADTVVAHLQFHLRNEIVQLEFLQRLFERLDSQIIQDWIDAEPTGQYARRTDFLYVCLTDKDLRVPDNIGGNYVDLLSAKWLVTSSPKAIKKNSRWRVNDNLAGNRDFCPTIIKTAPLTQAGFADVIAHQTGKGDLLINEDALRLLQQAILGDSVVITQYGLRQLPVFVGQTHRFQEILHYIAPPHLMLTNKLAGLQAFWEKTIGQSSVMRAAVLAFGFIYIHPLADGNGWVHRFLFNDILRRDGVLPESVILPISGVIAESSSEQQRYAQLSLLNLS